jgi:lipopolysaccharide export LptBFGC system permease protein LptF
MKGETMNTSTAYVLIAILVIVIVYVLLFLVGRNRQENRLTPLAGLAFGFIVAGILFGENRYFGYAMLGIGILVAVIDLIARGRAR